MFALIRSSRSSLEALLLGKRLLYTRRTFSHRLYEQPQARNASTNKKYIPTATIVSFLSRSNSQDLLIASISCAYKRAIYAYLLLGPSLLGTCRLPKSTRQQRL